MRLQALNSKQRNMKKNGTELNEMDQAELDRVTMSASDMQKRLEKIRKQSRQHTMLVNDHRTKKEKQMQPPGDSHQQGQQPPQHPNQMMGHQQQGMIHVQRAPIPGGPQMRPAGEMVMGPRGPMQPQPQLFTNPMQQQRMRQFTPQQQQQMAAAQQQQQQQQQRLQQQQRMQMTPQMALQHQQRMNMVRMQQQGTPQQPQGQQPQQHVMMMPGQPVMGPRPPPMGGRMQSPGHISPGPNGPVQVPQPGGPQMSPRTMQQSPHSQPSPQQPPFGVTSPGQAVRPGMTSPMHMPSSSPLPSPGTHQSPMNHPSQSPQPSMSPSPSQFVQQQQQQGYPNSQSPHGLQPSPRMPMPSGHVSSVHFLLRNVICRGLHNISFIRNLVYN